ncbi:DUF4489 domain-containing protein [Pseudalkalibacillus sp. SCS-8]|uniref:DUF4489 domain-containing protein n=1 Tax=Pseudalkalibacillus nanhaiensis TaxID=3115291 RepID=UPI0032DB3286
MHEHTTIPFLKCGDILRANLPRQLSKKNPPINLAEVTVNLDGFETPGVLFNYSQILSFRTMGMNPKITIVYRVIRTSERTQKVKVIDTWTFSGSEIFPTSVPNLDTIEPLVLNFCDCPIENSNDTFTYTVQIIEIITNNTTFAISRQEISAIVARGEAE